MMDYYEYLDDYMDGTLDPNLHAQFEKELAVNSDLQQAVENYPLAKKIAGANLVQNEEVSFEEERKFVILNGGTIVNKPASNEPEKIIVIGKKFCQGRCPTAAANYTPLHKKV